MPQNSSDPPSTSNASSGPSEFTQIFGKLPVPDAPNPFAPESTHGAGTPAFSSPNQDLAARPVPNQTSSTLFRETEPSEAPTQIFAAVPHASRPVHGTFATDETRIFGPPVVAQPPVANSPVVAAAPLPPAPAAASEFTSVFQPIALPPSMPTPAAAPATASGSGEFTQFFSAISARAGGAEQHTPPAPAPPSAAPKAPPAPQPQAGEFTQLFQQQQAMPKQPAPTPAAVAQPARAAVQPQSEPGSFTQLFSQAAVPSAPLPSAPPPMPGRAAEAAAPPASQPIFGAPAPRGSFTDIFPSSPAAQPTASKDTRFDDLFGPPSAPAFPPEPAAMRAAAPPAFNPPVPPSPPVPLAAAPGEFTQLMSALERPANPTPAAAAPLPVDAAFFAHAPASSAGESEYTRVMRGSGAAAPARAPIGAPAAGSAAAPGLALAPAPKENKAKDKPAKEKPKLFVILLVVMNVLLLLALIIIGFVLLHRR